MANVTLFDNFKNLVANLNTPRDKQSSGEYVLTTISDAQWSTIYRTSWMAKKIVDIPASDATRKWREWQADDKQIRAIEDIEENLRLPQKVRKALSMARLYGGSGIYFSIKNDDPSLPLDISAVGRGDLEFVTVLPKTVLTAGTIELDPLSQNYGKPKWYEITSGTSGTVRVDPSRIAIFVGTEFLTQQETVVGADQGWGDSVLMAAYDAVRNADSTGANIASMVYEAKVDVLQIPELASIMANPRTRKALEDRVMLSAQLKGNNGMLVIDGEETYEQKTFNFAGLPEISYQALQAVSGSADIPLTRFLGQSPAGLSSTGESDLKNYYDSVNSMQRLVITPALHNLDQCLVRSALGDYPEDVYYEWSSLWQMSDEQKSNISKQTAETINILAQSGLFADDDLAEAAATLLVEHSILPTFEYNELGSGEEFEEPDPAIETMGVE